MYGPDWDEGCPSCSVGRRRLRRDAPAPAEPRRRVHRGVACTARRSCSPTATAWAGASRGRRRRRATSTSTSTCRSPRSRSRTDQTYNFRALEGWQLDPANLPYEGPGMSAFVARGRRRVPHVLRVLAGRRRAVEHVAVARPRAERPQRGRLRGSVATTRTRGATGDARAHRRRPVRGAARADHRDGQQRRDLRTATRSVATRYGPLRQPVSIDCSRQLSTTFFRPLRTEVQFFV